MKRRERGRAGRGQVGVKIDAVQVDEIDRPPLQRDRDGAPVPRPGAPLGGLIERPCLARDSDQSSGGPGALLRHDDRAAACLDQRAVELGQHLLRPTDRVRADRRQRIGDAEDGEIHAARSSRSSVRAARTSACQCAPVMPQS